MNEINQVSKALTRKDLWDIAAFIVEKQQKNLGQSTIQEDVHWELVEEDWFNFLEKEVFGEQ